MVLSFVPFSGVFTLTLIEDEIAEFGSLSVLKVAQVDLFQVVLFLVVNSDEASAVWLAVELGAMVDRAILKILDRVLIVSAEGHHPSDCFLVALPAHDLEVEIFVAVALHFFDRPHACLRGSYADSLR